MTDQVYSAADEQKLMTDIWAPDISENLRKFVMFVFPWGKVNTPLHNFKEPRKWQIEELEKITQHIADNRNLMRQKKNPLVYKFAQTSGRGPGKSTLTAWLNLWNMSTNLGSTTVNTANTEMQLKSRTWAELGKWHTLSINSHWFDRSALTLKPSKWFEEALKKQLKVDTGYYYSQAQLWSEENPDAFAGVHNHNGVMVIFDEASGIPKPIWTVTEGFFTEPILHRYWFVFSNPRRNTGAFFECFHKNRKFWRTRKLDSRDVEGIDKTVLDGIIEQFGEDSDEARIEVKGEFPRQGDRQFISRGIINDAIKREIQKDSHAALMMGVDPARYGDDSTVIRFRQGRNGKIIPPTIMKHADTMEVANRCAELISKYDPDAVCIDAGNGVGVIDRLREMKYKVHEVWFGSKSSYPEWANKRTEIWAAMREWLKGSTIDNDQQLLDDLSAPEYKFKGHSDQIMLESKEEMKKRGFASPDHGDALACTFAVKVASKKLKVNAHNRNRRVAQDLNYRIFN